MEDVPADAAALNDAEVAAEQSKHSVDPDAMAAPASALSMPPATLCERETALARPAEADSRERGATSHRRGGAGLLAKVIDARKDACKATLIAKALRATVPEDATGAIAVPPGALARRKGEGTAKEGAAGCPAEAHVREAPAGSKAPSGTERLAKAAGTREDACSATLIATALGTTAVFDATDAVLQRLIAETQRAGAVT